MIRQLDVDGVPALLAPTSGPVHAGLMFRVGQADETLARRGVTHLLEHLVLHPLGTADYHYNGSTGSVVTQFHLQGSVDDVTTFLTGVCQSLRQLPLQRLGMEKDILRTEWSNRGSSVTDPIPLWRHGARDHGLVAFPEWGLSALTGDDLQQWVARYFTRENAVLWLAGDDIPAGLRLDLPSGVRMPTPAASSALPTTPAYFPGGSRSTVYDAVVARDVAASVFSGVLEREMFRALRQRDGLSYTAATHYEPRGDGYSVITALADALPQKQDAVLGGMIDVLAKVRVGRIEEADVAAVIGKATDALATADADRARLPSAAFNLLTGYPVDTSDDLLRQIKAVTPQDVHRVATEAAASSLLMTPYGRSADWAGFVAAPSGSTETVDGTTHPGLDDLPQKLIVGAQGVSIVTDPADPSDADDSAADRVATVRYDRCVAMLAWPDGGRQLIGDDAIVVRVEPTLYRDVDPAAVDAAVPPQLRVDLPPRDPDEIPRPDTVYRKPTAPKPPGVRDRLRRLPVRERVKYLLSAFWAVFCAVLGVGIGVGIVTGAVGPGRVVPMIAALGVSVYVARSLLGTWRELGE
ncbi:M16 family metallopeptidase [Solwaraspora sp. WMMA2101]|uniref:M16 family metallopeptidase n=1 Tax=Solwaraspora sp. WMMA2101 TaxID=3404124 RepID=UPI003B962CF6